MRATDFGRSRCRPHTRARSRFRCQPRANARGFMLSLATRASSPRLKLDPLGVHNLLYSPKKFPRAEKFLFINARTDRVAVVHVSGYRRRTHHQGSFAFLSVVSVTDPFEELDVVQRGSVQSR